MRNILLSLALTSLSTPAFAAGLYACNETGNTIHVAMGHFVNNTWSSNGFTTIPQATCAQLTFSFTATRYFLYAKDDNGKVWEGTHPFCGKPDIGFNFPNGTDFGNCPTLNFFSVWVPDMVTGAYPDHHAVVIGPDNTNLNHPRSER